MNRSVSMDRIKYIGFDMDYTLVGKVKLHVGTDSEQARGGIKTPSCPDAHLHV